MTKLRTLRTRLLPGHHGLPNQFRSNILTKRFTTARVEALSTTLYEGDRDYSSRNRFRIYHGA